jgi:uncharacterized protein YlzI (FlbEa/FlbD family)
MRPALAIPMSRDHGSKRGCPLITLTKLDKQKILVNLENIKYIEQVPDTLIFFTNGESVMVLEDMDQVAKAVADYHASVIRLAQQSESPSL